MAEAIVEHRLRVRVFVDFWNFQLSLNKPSSAGRFEADWKVLGGVLAGAAAEIVDEGAQVAYQGMDVYGSYGEGNERQEGRAWRVSPHCSGANTKVLGVGQHPRH